MFTCPGKLWRMQLLQYPQWFVMSDENEGGFTLESPSDHDKVLNDGMTKSDFRVAT